MGASASSQNAEHREYRRVADAVGLVLARVDGSADGEVLKLPNHPTHVVNLSPNGLLAYHSHPFAAGEEVTLLIRLFPEGSTLTIKGEVKNSGERSESPRSHRYFVGISFRDVSDENRTKLLDHVESVARKAFSGTVKIVN